MTWLIRVKNPDMNHPNRILHGELVWKIGDIFRSQGITYDKVQVSWENEPEPESDPFHGQRDHMVKWLHMAIAENFDDLKNADGRLTVVGLIRVLREEWMDNRWFSGKENENPYIHLRCYAEVARQVLKGWSV